LIEEEVANDAYKTRKYLAAIADHLDCQVKFVGIKKFVIHVRVQGIRERYRPERPREPYCSANAL
jgi:hypothetical protein